VSSCLQSSNVTTNKSSCKQLFDNHRDSQSPILKESNRGKYSLDNSMEKVDSITILKDFNKQNSKSECLTEMKLPKIVCMSNSMPEIISLSFSKTDKIISDTPNWSQKEIPYDTTDKIISHTPNWSQKEIQYDKTDSIIGNTPSLSQKEILHDKTDDVTSISLMSRNDLENTTYKKVYESFEPWSIHRTPAKLRGMYTWSPFFKTK